jgi:predicted O-linked N-acetylglucosamine transferase (SPINDLY family)
LALTLWNRGSLLAACAAADESLKRGGKPARAWELKANIAVGLGSAPDALACYRALLDVAPEADTHSRLLMTMQYCDTVSEDDIFAETQAWVRRHVGDLVPTTAWPNIAFAPEKPLTFGALSRDFRQCSTLFLARPLFDNLPPEWTVVFYSNVEAPDTWTEFFRRSCESWVDVVGADDATVAQKIMADGVDVLLDLNGHTLGGRPGVFARKPAPVQIAWLDYVGTTGLSTMDAIIADAGHVPRTEQGRYVEPIVHVPDDLYRYAPPIDAPAVTPLPALQNGFVTFGCFNSAYKLSDMTLALWAEILRAMPTARLLLNASEYQYEDTRARFTQRFADLGVAAAQIVFQPGASDPLGMLRAYANVDLALDPMPYSGGLTTIEGLYMGVPVVTLPGSRFGSRHSAVHLRTVGLAAWIADDRAGYVRLALEHAADLQALAVLRAELRPRVMRSTLLDGPGFARDFCGAIRALWRSACRRAASV